MTLNTTQPATETQDTIPARAFVVDENAISCWEPAPAAPHTPTRGCCDTCEATFAAADAGQAWRDYSRGDLSQAEVLAAQSYADYRRAVADGTLDSYEYAAAA